MAKSFVKAITAESINAAGFGGGFVPINEDGLEQACFLIRIINGSNVVVSISYDGIAENDVLLPNETLQLDFQTNSSPNGYIAWLKKGTIVYADASMAGVGFVLLAGYYQEI